MPESAHVIKINICIYTKLSEQFLFYGTAFLNVSYRSYLARRRKRAGTFRKTDYLHRRARYHYLAAGKAHNYLPIRKRIHARYLRCRYSFALFHAYVMTFQKFYLDSKKYRPYVYGWYILL